MRLLIATSSSSRCYNLKHDAETIRRLHERCVSEPRHARSKSCEVYRKAVETFNRELDDAVDTESAGNVESK